MKNIALNIAIVALVFAAACSTPPTSKQEDLTALLPANIIGFVTGDMQSKQSRDFLASPAYKTYMSNLERSLEQNKELTGDFALYWDVLKTLRFIPSKDQHDLPYASILFYAVPSEQRPFDFAAYYNATSDVDARELLASAQSKLEAAKIAIENIPQADYRAVIVRPFADGVAPAVQAVYRDQLKLDAFYVGASQSRFVIASSKELLERGFGVAKNEAKQIMESAEYKRAVSDASAGRQVMTVGMIDAKQIFRQFAPQDAATDTFPLSIIGLAAALDGDLISLNAVALLNSATPEMQKLKKLLEFPAAGQLFDLLPNTLAMGIAIDAGTLSRFISEFEAGAPAEALDLIKRMQSVGIGIQVAESASLYPEVIVAAKASDPEGLVAAISQLSSQMLPPGVIWRDAKFGDLDGKILTTPLGIGVRLAHNADTVVVATGDKVVLDVLGKDASKRLAGSKPVAHLARFGPSARAGIFMNYPNLAALAQSFIQSAAVFAKDAPQFPQQNFDQMKYMGEVAFTIGYEKDALHIAYSQHLSSK